MADFPYIYPLLSPFSSTQKPSSSTHHPSSLSLSLCNQPCLKLQRSHSKQRGTTTVWQRRTRRLFSSLKMSPPTLIKSRRGCWLKFSPAMPTLSTCTATASAATLTVTPSRNSCLSSPTRICSLISPVSPMGIPL